MFNLVISEYSLNLNDNKSVTINESDIRSVFGVGDGMHGQLGVDVFIKSDVPIRINKLKKIIIKKISCGGSHTVVLAENGLGILSFIISSFLFRKILYAIYC